MKPTAERPDVARVLAGLKPFQRETVETVFQRMYLDPDPTFRFLVADEVGLGKTLVARGVIARAIDHLWETIPRIDVIYICSNADIARQNVRRLNVTGSEDFALASRITLLPVTLKDIKNNKLNFVSFTPGTSFDLNSSLGTRRERYLLHCLLRDPWDLRGSGPYNALQGNIHDRNKFRDAVKEFADTEEIDDYIAGAFAAALAEDGRRAEASGEKSLRARFEALCEAFGHSRQRSSIPGEEKDEQSLVVGRLRAVLAETCLKALEPDLVILDEFQRFKHLLATDDDAGRLARQLFDYSDQSTDARVLLLSATPYKMYTMYGEEATEDHYQDFLQTLTFLESGMKDGAGFRSLLEEYRRRLYDLAEGDGEGLRAAKDRLEERLRRVMVRTERLAVTGDRNGMLVEIPSATTSLSPADVGGYRAIQSVADRLERGDILEYWKSAPYLLNFMDAYLLKEDFKDAAEDPEANRGLAALLHRDRKALLSWDTIRTYGAIDPGNARLRDLVDATLGGGAWRLLWLPPSLPYYAPAGPFADPALRNFTKRLVFSSWTVVPKVIATLLSYEAERRILTAFEKSPQNTPEARKARRPLLRFSRTDDRLTGMPVLALLYPGFALAKLGDPVALTRESAPGDPLPTRDDVLELVRRRIAERLPALTRGHENASHEDESWYWAAPLLLDLEADRKATLDWFDHDDLATLWIGTEDEETDDTEDTGWADHVARAREVVERGPRDLGKPPADLDRVLALLALAGPGVTSLRALSRIAEDPDALKNPEVRNHAGAVAWAFRSLWNRPESMALLRAGAPDVPYWRLVLDYGANGCLQSVLDEFAHVLRDSEGARGAHGPAATRNVAGAMAEALSLRTPSLDVDEVSVDPAGESFTLERGRMRAHFALRFGNLENEDGSAGTRADQVRRAFNSPFWPFVLGTTSVGQEGLDFHPYCHAVVHWNLPPNPVDLEQREGRVHRFKGHAVRKNVASVCRGALSSTGGADPWDDLFEAAQATVADASGLVPFWVFQPEGGARIERHVPSLPLSRDRRRLEALRRSLAVYRMVFGQPRQEDLLAFLLERVGAEKLKKWAPLLRIDLSPAGSRS